MARFRDDTNLSIRLTRPVLLTAKVSVISGRRLYTTMSYLYNQAPFTCITFLDDLLFFKDSNFIIQKVM